MNRNFLLALLAVVLVCSSIGFVLPGGEEDDFLGRALSGVVLAFPLLLLLLPVFVGFSALARWRTDRSRSRELVHDRLATRLEAARETGESWTDAPADADGGEPAPEPAGPSQEDLWVASLWPAAILWFLIAAGYGVYLIQWGEGRAGVFGLVLVMFSWLPMAFLAFRHRVDRKRAADRQGRARARLAERLSTEDRADAQP